jgi:uncharacterized paraquat-inducible protein A
MPYQHCRDCRLTVHITSEDEAGAPCPRCGGTLADKPRSLFVRPSASPEAVRATMALRGGRFRRETSRPAAS